MISVDVSEVPPDKQTRPDFLSLKSQMEQALRVQSWIAAFCIHEAGHLIYFEQVGVTKYTINAPRIVFNDKTGQFDGYMLSIQPEEGAPPKDLDLQKYLNDVAKAHVAGSTFAKKLANAPDAGDEEDRALFDQFCKMLEQKFLGTTIDRQDSWNQAAREVLVDLRSPEFRRKAWAKANAIREQMFGT
jgi:hypothetical protein